MVVAREGFSHSLTAVPLDSSQALDFIETYLTKNGVPHPKIDRGIRAALQRGICLVSVGQSDKSGMGNFQLSKIKRHDGVTWH